MDKKTFEIFLSFIPIICLKIWIAVNPPDFISLLVKNGSNV